MSVFIEMRRRKAEPVETHATPKKGTRSSSTTTPTPATRKRNRMEVRTVTDEDYEAYRELESALGPDKRAEIRVVETYEAFAAMNALDPVLTALPPFMGMLMNQHIAASTIETYIRYIVKKYRNPANTAVLKLAQRAHAREGGNHAPDVPRQVLLRIVKRIRDDTARHMCLLLLCTGMRPCALQELTADRVHAPLTMYGLRVEIRLDKTIKKRAEQNQLLVPLEVMPEGLTSLQQRQKLAKLPPGRPFAKYGAARLNAILEAASKKGEVAPTTYSFRRAYFNALMSTLAPDGDVSKILRFTLHASERCLKSHYLDWKSLIE